MDKSLITYRLSMQVFADVTLPIMNFRQVRLAAVRELQSATGEELRSGRTLLPSVLRPSGGRLRESCAPIPSFPLKRGRRIESWNGTKDNQF